MILLMLLFLALLVAAILWGKQIHDELPGDDNKEDK